MKDLSSLRQSIDAIDAELVELFRQRMQVAEQVAEYKIQHHLPVLDPERERAVIAAKTALVDTPEERSELARLYQSLMALSRERQRRVMQGEGAREQGVCDPFSIVYPPVERPRVVYQGMPGAYSEAAAIRFFGEDVDSRGLSHFEDSFVALERDEADYAVLPIENSTTGAIRQVHDLMGRYGFYMVGETTVRVHHCLMALPGARLEDIKTVYSHEQGLFQSDRFLDAHPDWTRVPLLDTAGSAKFVRDSGDRTKAAICSARAAAVYGLEILVEGTNHNQENYTRFAVIRKVPELRQGRDKITAVFTLPHQSGSLHEILTIFAVNDLNLVKLESRPLPGRRWEYQFYVEFTGDLRAEGMDAVLRELEQTTGEFRIVGNYKANLGDHDAV